MRRNLKLTQLGSLQIVQVVRFGSLFLGSVILAKLLRDPVLIGAYENLVLIGSSFTFFWVSGMMNTYIPYFHKTPAASERKSLISSIYIVFIILSCLIAVALLLFKNYLFQGETSHYLYYIIFAFTSAIAYITDNLYVTLKKQYSTIIYGIVTSFLQLAALTLPLLFKLDFIYSLLSLAFFGTLKLIFTHVLVLKVCNKITFSFRILKPFLKAAWPVIISFLIGGSMLYVDGFIVKHYFSLAEFAYFQYGARELPFVLLMANALSNIASGEVSKHNTLGTINKGLEFLHTKSIRLMHLLFPLSLLLLLGSNFLFYWVYNEAFVASAHIFDIYLLLIVSRLVFPQTVLLALQKNKILLWAVAAEWFVKIALNLLLLPVFGLAGIAYATVGAFFTEKIIHLWALARYKIYIHHFTPVKTLVFYSAILITAFVLKQLFL